MAMFTHMYIPSCMFWKGSDLMVATGKSTEEHFARTDGPWRWSDWTFFFLSIFVIFLSILHRSRERALGLDGKEGTRDFCLRDTKTWMSMYHT